MSYSEWTSQLEDALCRKGVSAKERERAEQYWQEAYSDRIEAGMSEAEAVSDLGSVDTAAEAVVESLPPFQKSFLGLRQNRERTALVAVLLILGAIVWIPLTFALAITAAAVYVALWAFILAAWAFEASGYLFGAASVVAFILAATSGNWAAGALDGGICLALGGAAVLLTPVAIQLTSVLFRTSIRFGRWIAHFFVRVAQGSDAAMAEDDPITFWWTRHPDACRIMLVVGGIILAAGLALVLIALISCGFQPETVPALPAVDAGPLGRVSFPHFPDFRLWR